MRIAEVHGKARFHGESLVRGQLLAVRLAAEANRRSATRPSSAVPPTHVILTRRMIAVSVAGNIVPRFAGMNESVGSSKHADTNHYREASRTRQRNNKIAAGWVFTARLLTHSAHTDFTVERDVMELVRQHRKRWLTQKTAVLTRAPPIKFGNEPLRGNDPVALFDPVLQHFGRREYAAQRN